MQPDGGAQIIQHGKHRQRHRDKEERTAQQCDLPSARKIADPHGIVQKQEQRGKLFVIRPDFPLSVKRAEKDPAKLTACYEIGRRTAEKELVQLIAFMNHTEN